MTTQNLRNAQTERRYLTRFRSEEHTSELQSRSDLVCRLLLEKKKKKKQKRSEKHIKNKIKKTKEDQYWYHSGTLMMVADKTRHRIVTITQTVQRHRRCYKHI